MDAEERDEVIEAVGDIGISTFGDGVLHGFLGDFDGGEDRV